MVAGEAVPGSRPAGDPAGAVKMPPPVRQEGPPATGRPAAAPQMAKVDAKGKAEADYFFKLRKEEATARSRNGGRPRVFLLRARS